LLLHSVAMLLKSLEACDAVKQIFTYYNRPILSLASVEYLFSAIGFIETPTERV